RARRVPRSAALCSLRRVAPIVRPDPHGNTAGCRDRRHRYRARRIRRHAHPAPGVHCMSETIVFAERAIAPGGDLIWPAALEHLARRFASIRELDLASIPVREDAVPALEEWAGDDVSS